MKTLFILAYFLALPFVSMSQCKDVYGNTCDCPTLEDSLVLYVNAISVIDYYDNNKSYKKVSGKDIRLDFEKREIFDLMKQSRKLFTVLRRELALIKEDPKFLNLTPKVKYKDITFEQYYKPVNKYRFYQRELENQIVNRYSPAPLYDYRIAPIFVNEYLCVDSTSEFLNDLVNIPMYVPVVVKPDKMLSDSERVVRNEILKSYNVHEIYLKLKQKKFDDLLNRIKTENKKAENKKIQSYQIVSGNNQAYENCHNHTTMTPIYYHNPVGGSGLIGFMCGRFFKKIQPADYQIYAVPNYCKELLQNEEKLKFYLKTLFGDYFLNIYNVQNAKPN